MARLILKVELDTPDGYSDDEENITINMKGSNRQIAHILQIASVAVNNVVPSLDIRMKEEDE